MPPDTAAAYAVQSEVMRQLGGRVSWKMALLGGRDRHAAPMPADEVLETGTALPVLPLDAGIEVETAFILGSNLPAGSMPGAALDAVADVRLAFEVVASRYADRSSVPPLVAMADSFSSAAIVLGDTIPDWRKHLDQPLGLTLALDGQPITVVEQTPSLSETADFLSWLASHAAEQGLPLTAGTAIITGARIGPVPTCGARRALACFGSIQVRVAFSGA